MNAPGWEKSLAKLDDFLGGGGGRVFASFLVSERSATRFSVALPK